MELIDRKALLEKACYRGKPATVYNPYPDGAEVVDVEDIECAPVIEAAPIIHAKWEEITDGLILLGNCSSCKTRQPIYGTNYCRNCGAKVSLED